MGSAFPEIWAFFFFYLDQRSPTWMIQAYSVRGRRAISDRRWKNAPAIALKGIISPNLE